MSQCPFCGSTDIEKPMFGGKELEGSPNPGLLQLRKAQKCRTCNNFFEPPLPKPVAALIIFFLTVASLGFMIGGFSEGKYVLSLGGVGMLVLSLLAMKRYLFTKNPPK
jgi:hypothetical protein